MSIATASAERAPAPNTYKSSLQRVVVTWLTEHPDVTSAELARRSEIDPSDLRKISKGDKSSLNMESAARLAGAMGTTVEGLLGNETPAVPASLPNGVRMVPIEAICPSPHNPRKTFDDEGLAELAASIAAQGLLQPLVVREIIPPEGKGSLTGPFYELVAGERRLRALKLNGATEALCVIRTDDDATTRALQIIENLQREDIKPMEEAEAFAELQDADPARWTVQAIASAIGKTDRFVQQRLALARSLSPAAQKAVAKGDVTVEAARVLATYPASLQAEALKARWPLERGADGIRDYMMRIIVPVGNAAFDRDLYDGEIITEGKKSWFADPAKFEKLQSAAIKEKLKELQAEYPAAKQIGPYEAHSFVWADTGEKIVSKAHKVDLAKVKVPKARLTAVLWIDDRRVRTAMHVTSSKAYESAVRTKDETAKARAEKDYRRGLEEITERFNDALMIEVAQRPALVARLHVHAQLSGWGIMTDSYVRAILLGATAAEALAPLLCPTGKGGWKRYQGDDDKLMAALAALADNDIIALHARLVTAMVAHVFSHHVPDLAEHAIKVCGLTVPDHLQNHEGEPGEPDPDAEAGGEYDE